MPGPTALVPFMPIAFHIPPPLPTSPGFIVQVTPLTIPNVQTTAAGSLMVWIGVGDGVPYKDDSEQSEVDAEKNEYEKALAEEGGDGQQGEGYRGSKRLGADWACAMPSRLSTSPTTSTTLLTSSLTSSTPTSRSETIARRLSQKLNCQVFLSMDLPVEAMVSGVGAVGGGDAVVGRMVLGLERGLGEVLRELRGA